MTMTGQILSSSALAGIALSALVILASNLVYYGYFSRLRDVPGPSLARFTRLWHIRHIIKGDLPSELTKQHERHGHFVRIAPNEASISHPDAVRHVLLANLDKSPWYRIMALPDHRFRNSFATLQPKAKLERSKYSAPAFVTANVLSSEPEMDNVIQELKDWMDKYSEDGKAMDLDKFISFTTYDTAGEVMFSKPFGFLKTGLDIGNSIARVAMLNAYIGSAGFMIWLHRLTVANPIITDMSILPYGHLYNTAVAAIEDRAKNPEGRFDMATHWFRSHHNSPSDFTMTDVHSQATLTLGAAADTTSTVTQSFIYHVVRHTTAAGLLRQEIKEAQVQGRCATGIVSYADAQEMPYLQACLKEAIRIFTPITMSLARTVGPAGLQIGTERIPSGTIVSVNPWVMHHSVEHWGSNATEFDPGRWLGEDAPRLEKFYMPFGHGYATCPGRFFGLIQASKICATLFRDYDISQVDSTQEWAWKARISALPHSWPVTIERRNGGF